MAAVVSRALSRRVATVVRRAAPAVRTGILARATVRAFPAVRSMSSSTGACPPGHETQSQLRFA